jgi:hypothetical protein
MNEFRKGANQAAGGCIGILAVVGLMIFLNFCICGGCFLMGPPGYRATPPTVPTIPTNSEPPPSQTEPTPHGSNR